MIYVVYVLHVVTCLFLILVVLLQQGKGADLSVFGGGSTQAAFGARGAATLLHKLTVAFFILFMVTTISIGVLQRGRSASSVMQGVATPKEQPAAPAPAAPPAPQPPAAAQAPAPAPAASDRRGRAPASDAPAAPAESGSPPSEPPSN